MTTTPTSDEVRSAFQKYVMQTQAKIADLSKQLADAVAQEKADQDVIQQKTSEATQAQATYESLKSQIESDYVSVYQLVISQLDPEPQTAETPTTQG